MLTKIIQKVKNLLQFEKDDPENTSARTADALRFLYTGYRLLGVHMPQLSFKRFYILYAILLNICVTVYFPIAFLISYMQMSAEDLEIGNLLTSIQVAIDVWGCSIKIIIMAVMLRRLRSADPLIAKMDARCQDKDEIEEIKNVGRLGNRLVVLFCMAYWTYSSSTFISALFARRVPYGVYIPYFKWNRSTSEFYITAFIEIALMDVACFQQVVDDAYAVIYVCILRAHMRILLLRVSKLCANPQKTPAQNLEDLKQCILDHKNLVQLHNIIAPVISITIFVQFMITAILLGTTLINILIFATDFPSRVASCFYILAVVVEIFPLCYHAQCLMNESNCLANAIFHSNWVEQKSGYRKMLIFFIHRSQRTMELTAGKLFPITLNSFLSIAKFSFTLYTFIKEMGIKEKLGLHQIQ